MSDPLRAPRWIFAPLQESGRRWLESLRRAAGQGRQRTFRYEEQETQQSLREGLDEYYSSDPDLLAPTNVSDEVASQLRAHDAAHVVFGCDTSVRGEVVLARWSLFGAADALSIYLRGLRSKETRFLFSDFLRKVRPRMVLLVVIDGGRALLRSLHMRRRWPSLDWEQYADRPLAEIRSELGIRIV